MFEHISVFHIFVEPLSLTVMLIFLYGLVDRTPTPDWMRKLATGVIFGAVAAYSMSSPIVISDTVSIDLRALFVGLAMAHFGPIAGIFALLVAIGAPTSIGGAELIPGLPLVAFATVFGLLWRQTVRPRTSGDAPADIILGCMISASSAVAAIFSAPMASEVFRSVAPYLILAHIVGAVMTGMLIRREQEQIAETSKLTTEAMTDPLTQLLNRRSVQRIVTELPKPKNPKLGHAMLYMDIDHFKHINDKLGHAAGDEIIQKVRDRVRQCLRPVDIFSRLGGDEFLVVLPAISIEDSTRVAERCRTAVAETPFRIGEESLHVSLSIGAHWAKGIAVFDNHLNHADTALYQAKENGRNAVSFYDVEPSLLIEVA